jgi:crotonobetainyl-CoA:carnitine CoA-transferase CaiB-like acyl-CoA transferase
MVNERNRNKLDLALDLNSQRGREIFLELVKVSDAVSHNYSRRVMPNLGLDYAALSAVNPRIIVVALMSQGLDGPESDYVSYGGNLEQLGGISYFSGYTDDPYSSVGFALPDPLGGATAAFSLLAALRHREQTGRGMEIDISQREAASLVIGRELVEYSLTGRNPPRLGNHEPGCAPSDCYPCLGEDEWVAISIGSDAEWAGLCDAMHRPSLAQDRRFQTIVGRLRNREELDEIIAIWTRTLPKREVCELLQSCGVPAGAALNPRELFTDIHLRSRGFWERTEDYSAGEQVYYGRPYRLPESELGTRLPTPKLGQHNRYVLETILGLPSAEVDNLEAEGIVGTKPILTAEGGMAGRREA